MNGEVLRGNPYEDLPKGSFAFFSFVTGHAWKLVILGFIFIAGLASFIPTLVKDTTIDAFIDPSNEAIQYRDFVKDQFGLKDPIVVALVGAEADSIYSPGALTEIRGITQTLKGIENIDPEKVISLATASGIIGTEDELLVDPIIADGALSDEDAALARSRVLSLPLYEGNLVTADGSAAIVIAEVMDPIRAGQTYQQILDTLPARPLPGFETHIAGTGAIDGYLAKYIDADSRKLQPAIFLVILIMLFVAFRTGRSVFLPLFVILGTVAGSIGVMAMMGIPYYAISSALPVILVGISVADSIHVLTYYYHERELHPALTSRELTVRACTHVWRPLVFTSVTTILGFAGIAITAIMPPMFWFSIFAIAGVATALVFSLTVLPAALSKCKPKSCKALASSHQGGPIARVVAGFSKFAVRHATLVMLVFLMVIGGGIYGVATLKVERAAINNFKDSEPIRRADDVINTRFNGTTYLDIVIEAEEPGLLYEPEILRRIEALQTYAETIDTVGSSVSIIDYLKPLYRAVNADDPDFYTIPEDRFLIEQLFLLHSATGDPTDFEEEVDPNFQTALVRLSLKTGLFSEVSRTVTLVQTYVDQSFNDAQVTAILSGRATLDHNWLSPLKASHFQSLAVSLLLIWIAALFLFRSVTAGIITILPVLTAILMIYSAMGVFDIWLEPATSMFAPIAIGLGVDFSIHVIERVQYYVRHKRMFLMQAVSNMSKVSGRALFFNFASIFLGFGVLTMSELPMLIRFGALTMIALLASYLTALMLLPAMVSFLNTDRVFRRVKGPTPTFVALLLAVGAAILAPSALDAQETRDGRWYAEQVASRAEPENIEQTLKMTLIDRKGREKVRTAKMLRKTDSEERRTIIAFSQPRSIKDTAFMTHDFSALQQDDNQWLYLPALRRSRRISSSDRGDYFLGTDFTYEDIKDSTKFSLADYAFEATGVEEKDGVQYQALTLTPKSPEIAEELGYSMVKTLVNPANWMPVTALYFDVAGNELKTITLEDQAEVDGYWTARRITATNHKTGHQTIFELTDIDYAVDLEMAMFSERRLRSGL